MEIWAASVLVIWATIVLGVWMGYNLETGLGSSSSKAIIWSYQIKVMIQKIGPSSAGLAAPLFNQYRMFYGQASDLALAEQYLYERLTLGESVVFLAFKEETGTSSVGGEPAEAMGGESTMAALTPIGFAQLYPILSSISATRNWLLNDLFVDPDYRKLSVGKALLQKVFDFALEQGASTVTLETGVNNFIAQGLYEQIGFVRQEPETGYYTYRKNLVLL